MAAPNAPSEFRHVLMLNGCQNVEVEGLGLGEAGGDGLYVGMKLVSGTRVPCRGVLIRDIEAYNCHRDCCSVTSAINLTCTGSTFRNAKGTAPQAAVDVEPANQADWAQDVLFDGCEALDCEGHGFVASLLSLGTASPGRVGIRFANCRVARMNTLGLWCKALFLTADCPTGQVDFHNCVVTDTEFNGLRAELNSENPLALNVTRCTFERVARRSTQLPLDLNVILGGSDVPTKGLRFSACRVIDDAARYAIKMPTGGPAWVWGARGDLIVQNSLHPADLTPITNLWPSLAMALES
jgi:hypothetical protein